MKKINFVSQYEKKKTPKEKKFFYVVLAVCIVAVVLTSYITMYRDAETIPPKSPSAKEVVQNAQTEIDIPANETPKIPEVIIDEKKSEPEKIEIESEIEVPHSNETKIPQITEIEYTKMPLDGKVIKAHSVNTPVFSVTMNDWRIHEGIDISCSIGDAVYAVASGTIVDIYEDNALGYTVLIEHNGYSSKYCNLSSVEGLSVGVKVEQGKKIGIVGDSAKYEIADEPHLHFELLKDGKSVDPFLYIK